MTAIFPHQPGDRVRHPDHGMGTVREVGDRYIAILFDVGGEMLLKLEAADLEPEEGYPGAWPEDLDDDFPAVPEDSTPWPESTFLREEEAGEGRHFLGSHWDPFGGVEVWFNKFPEIVESEEIQVGFGGPDRQPVSRVIPADWPKGYIGAWPLRTKGLCTIHEIDEARREVLFRSMFPFFAEGSQHTATLEQVLVWKGGCEAQIVVTLGDAEVVFFDAHYLINRAWYKAGETYDFIFTGMAYNARPIESEPFKIQQDPEVAAWLARMEREQGREVLPVLEPTFSMKGMAALLPIPEWDADDYSFRGPIQSLREVDEILGQKAWILEVTVLRFSEDVHLKILVTHTAWQGDAPPKVGEDVEGRLWLQGYLWDVA